MAMLTVHDRKLDTAVAEMRARIEAKEINGKEF